VSGTLRRGESMKTRRLMRPYALIYLYRRRLRVHAVQELLAGVGIAIAVALVLAALVAEGSIAGSSREVVRVVVGPASLQLRARSGDGFEERVLARVENLAGVKQAAALLERTATLTGPHGRTATISLAGAEVSLATLDGLAHTLPIGAFQRGGIGLSRLTASELGVTAAGGAPSTVTLQLRGHSSPLKVEAVLGTEAVGALARAHVAVMPLASMQQLSGLPRRITRILVQAQPGQENSVRGELRALAGANLLVAGADQDVTLLRQALRPSDQASELFAVIGALLGFLFAFNAMMLTVPERRRAIADLRLAGTRRSAIVQMVLFQALCLGIAASLVGLLGGYALSRWVFHSSTGYLAQAFTLSSSTVIGAGPVLLAAIGGVLVTCLASAIPLLDLRRRRARDAVYQDRAAPGNALGEGSQRKLFAAAVTLVMLASALFAFIPSGAIYAAAALALATVLAMPLVFAAVLAAVALACEHYPRLTTLPIALASLKATTLRSLALAATGAVALFGSVALGGARANLLAGIGTFAHSYAADADVWVSEPGDNQAVNDFAPDEAARRIARLPEVASVQAFHGGFLTIGNRRVWVIARAPGADRHVLTSQIVAGNAASAITRLGEAGWIAISRQIADEHHVRLGGSFTIPTPTGNSRFKVAAMTTNLAWSPGVIFMSAADYSRAWASTAPSALAVQLRAGVNVAATRGAIARALGPGSGLESSAAGTREARINALANEGLGQLGEISMLLVLAAILAMAAALASSINQRRASLAGLRLSGARPARLRRVLLAESALMLGAGCVTGALAGIYGQFVIDGYLRHVTGFPVASPAASARPLEVLALVLGAALVIVAVPGWFAARVSPAMALREE
jgi:putative ABC transport system permease protein